MNIISQLKACHHSLRNILLRPFSGRQEQEGMTLIEIIVVMALIGGILGVLIGGITTGTKTARERNTELTFGQIRSSMQMYKLSMKKYPTTEQGLRALVENPGNPAWRGPYCEEEILQDAWDKEIQYESDGRSMKFVSAGEDEEFGTEDDIVWPKQKEVATR